MNATTRTTSARRRLRLARGGFTLIEAALTTIIVGLGTVAMMGLLSSGLAVNEQAGQLTTAVNLAENVHELCDRLPYPATTGTWGLPAGQTLGGQVSNSSIGSANLSWLSGTSASSYAGTTFNPPVDATDTPLATNTNDPNKLTPWWNWTQTVAVSNVDPNNVNSTITDNAANSMARVTVKVFNNGVQVYQTSWLVTR